MGYKLLGEIMVEDRILTPDQVETVLGYQDRDDQPFGDIAVKRFGVSPQDVWQSRAKQMQSTLHVVDLEKFPADRTAQGLVSKTEASLYWVLPVKFKRSVLTLATSATHIVQALPYFRSNLKCPTRFVLAAPGQLRDHIGRAYGVSTSAYTTYDLGGGSSVISRASSLNETELDRRRERASATKRLKEVYGIRAEISGHLVDCRCDTCQQRMRVPNFLAGFRIGCGACGSPTLIPGDRMVDSANDAHQQQSHPEEGRIATGGLYGRGQDRRINTNANQHDHDDADPPAAESAVPDKLKFFCYHCGHRLAVNVALAGRKVRCCHCNEVVRAPEKPTSPGSNGNGKGSTSASRTSTPRIQSPPPPSRRAPSPNPPSANSGSTANPLIRDSMDDDDSWFPLNQKAAIL